MSDSFVSVVADRDDPARLLVRGRRPGDVERFLAPVADAGPFAVSESPRADYRFRAFVPREVVARATSAHASAVDYPNFKNTVPTGVRHDAYMACWSAMSQLQDQPDVTEPSMPLSEFRARYEALGKFEELIGERTFISRCQTFEDFLKFGPKVADGFVSMGRTFGEDEVADQRSYNPGLFDLIREAWPNAKLRER